MNKTLEAILLGALVVTALASVYLLGQHEHKEPVVKQTCKIEE